VEAAGEVEFTCKATVWTLTVCALDMGVEDVKGGKAIRDSSGIK